MIITIDGPAASGKTSVAYGVARALGWQCLNTGMMYRAVALEALRTKTSPDDAAAVIQLAQAVKLEFDWDAESPELTLNGYKPLALLDLSDVSDAAKRVSSVQGVREALVEQQRRIALEKGNVVAEGRDQGSIVFRDAPFKFYLTADTRVRAERRQRQLFSRGIITDVELLEQELIRRDEQDRHTLASLGVEMTPDGATVIDSTGMTGEKEAIDLIVTTVRQAGS